MGVGCISGIPQASGFCTGEVPVWFRGRPLRTIPWSSWQRAGYLRVLRLSPVSCNFKWTVPTYIGSVGGGRGYGWGRRTSRISSCTSLILTPLQDVKVLVRSVRRWNCTAEGRSWLAGDLWGTGWSVDIRWSLSWYANRIHSALPCLLEDDACNSVQMTSPAACWRKNCLRCSQQTVRGRLP